MVRLAPGGMSSKPNVRHESFWSRHVTALTFSAAAMLRLIFYHSSTLGEVLDGRVEVSNSLMPLAVWLVGLFQWARLEDFLFILIDLLGAYYLRRIAAARLPPSSLLPDALAALLLFNPLSLMASIAKTLAPLTNTAILGAISHAIDGQRLISLFFVALGSYLSIYPIALLAPILLLLKSKGSMITNSFYFLLHLTALMATSRLYAGSWGFLNCSHGCRLTFASLRPNIGLYWYLFTEMFDFFRPLFIALLQLHIFYYVLPATFRFKSDPLFLAWILIALQTFLQPYPTIADVGLYLTMLFLFQNIISKLKWLSSQMSLLLMLFAAVQAPVNWYFWIYQGSGNANFYYATTLIFNVAQVMLILDVIRTYLKDQIAQLNPGVKMEYLYQK